MTSAAVGGSRSGSHQPRIVETVTGIDDDSTTSRPARQLDSRTVLDLVNYVALCVIAVSRARSALRGKDRLEAFLAFDAIIVGALRIVAKRRRRLRRVEARVTTDE